MNVSKSEIWTYQKSIQTSQLWAPWLTFLHRTLLIRTVGPPLEKFHNELNSFAELVPCTTPRPEAFKSRVQSILIPTLVPPKPPHRQCIPTNPQQVLPMALPEGIMLAYFLLGTFLLIFVESPQLYSS
jgi:hypothetical protein